MIVGVKRPSLSRHHALRSNNLDATRRHQNSSKRRNEFLPPLHSFERERERERPRYLVDRPMRPCLEEMVAGSVVGI